MSGKKACINCPSSFYTGKEQSPLHFGLSAEGYEVNAIMEGFDTELWIVEVRNNKKVWTKKEHINKLTYEKPVINDTLRTANDDATANQDNTADKSSSVGADFNAKNRLDGAEISNGEPDNDNVNSKNKASKTIKPTDYTLFITYRIHQMKKESTDNKKNYDCARYEWKEYKKKPDELKAIMIEANNFATNKNVN
jgi:hypothetical protein